MKYNRLHILASPVFQLPILQKHRGLGWVLALCFTHLQLHASTEFKDSLNLAEVVVTGTRTPKALKDVPTLTRLISEDDIRRSDATNIQDLLQQELPGVEFSYAMNQQPNMNVAGFAGQNVLILLDGERLSGETMDNTDFARLTMQNVKRIEIVKGAASALYGSNAAGGVINIITKEAEQPVSLTLDARLADHKEQRYGASLGLRSGKVGNVLSVHYTTIDTYDVCRNTADDCDFRKVFGSTTWNIGNKLTFQPTKDMKLQASAGYFFRERLYNADAPDRYRDFSAGIRGEWTPTERDNIELSYAFDQYDKSDYLALRDLDIRDYRNVQHRLRALYSHRSGEANILSIGGDYMRDYLDTYQFNDGAKVQYSGDVFAQYDHIFNERWEMVAAGRIDYFSESDKAQVTGKLNGRYSSESGIVFRAGYAGGFRDPSLKERYMRYDMSGIFWLHGNEKLKAEHSHSVNLSAEYSHGSYNFVVSAAHSIVTDKISTSLPKVSDTDATYQYVEYINLENVRVTNIEAIAKSRWLLSDESMLSARVAYNYTHEQVRGNNINQYCPARPHSLNLKADWDKSFSKTYTLSLSLQGRIYSAVDYTSMELVRPFNTISIHNPAYSLWKVQAMNNLGKRFCVTLAVDNIFNYAPKTYYYNSPSTLGVNLMLGVNYKL